jgi:hypothetical protein
VDEIYYKAMNKFPLERYYIHKDFVDIPTSEEGFKALLFDVRTKSPPKTESCWLLTINAFTNRYVYFVLSSSHPSWFTVCDHERILERPTTCGTAFSTYGYEVAKAEWIKRCISP